VTLLVRQVGEKRVQTIKSVGKVGRGGFGRDERQEEIAGEEPNLRRAKGTALESLRKGCAES
jgi:inorganic triphosphatase YgiF